MTTAILQTPLEVILFFSNLASHGVKSQSFRTISDVLKQDQFIRESEDFDEARLSPESLQQLYLTLLKEEVKNQKERTKSPSSPEQQENGSPNARKRKLSSPPLQSLGDAQEHEHLLPVLINKLYARYRDQALASIQREEEDYKRTQSKIGQLKTNQQTNGDDDTETKLPATPKQPDPPRRGPHDTISTQAQQTGSLKPTPASSHTSSVGDSSSLAAGAALKERAGRPSASDISKQTQILPTTGSLSSKQAQDSTPTQSPQIPPSRHGLDGQTLQTQTQTQTQAPAQFVAPYNPRVPAKNLIPSPGARPGTLASTSTAERPLQVLTQQQYAQQQGTTPSPAPSSITLAPSSVTAGRSPVSGPHSVVPNQTQSQTQASQPALPRPGYPHRGYPQDQRNAFQPQYLQFTPPNIPYQGGKISGAQYPAQAGKHHQSPVTANQSPGYPQQAFPAGSGSTTRPQFPGTPQQLLQQQGRQQLSSTPSQSTTQRHPLLPLDTSASSTKWKSTNRNREKSPDRPKLSPLRFDFDDYFSAEAGESREKAVRKSAEVDSARVSPADVDETPSRVPVNRGRGGRGRAGVRPASIRAGSASVSTRTRSRSGSPAEEQSAAHKRTGSRRVKREPGTPAEERLPSKSPSTAGTPLLSGRRRGDTLRSIDTPPHVRPSKRKFDLLEAGSPVSTGPATPRVPQIPTKPGHVLAVRALPRIAQTILNDVTTHKLASMFQKPISEREAPGYRDLVFQPQDLKTIRGQLSAGQKAIAAAELAAQEAGETLQNGPTTGSVWLERTADVIPPRAIVNSSQLETELCRIFANAVMFNPDPKRGVGPTFKVRARRAEASRREKLGVADSDDEEDDDDDVGDEGGSLVNDAREMFNDVEKQLANWRAAERTGVGDGLGGLESSKDESMVEENKDEDEAAATEGEEGRPSRRRRT